MLGEEVETPRMPPRTASAVRSRAELHIWLRHMAIFVSCRENGSVVSRSYRGWMGLVANAVKQRGSKRRGENQPSVSWFPAASP